VSQRVKVLEQQLGVRLFSRTTRSLALTEAGRTLLPHCQAVAASTEAALLALEAHRDQPRGTLVISAAKGPAHALVAPILPALLADHPAMQVELRVQEHRQDLVRDGIDVALRAGHVDTAHHGRRLGPLTLHLCASPALPEVTRVQDLSAAPWLAFTPVGNTLALRGETVTLVPRLQVDDGEVLRRLLVAGAGFGILPGFYIQEDLRLGRLQTWLDPIDAGSIWAIHPYARQAPPKVRVLLDRLSRVLWR
jgi:DNA-binding transcriptional LysR family regulator